MEPSHSKLSAAAVVVLLLILAAETGPVQAKECLSLSTTFRGPCFNSGRCNDACLGESGAYSGGKCRGLFLRCWCITPCATTTTMLLASPPAPTPAPTDQSGSDA